MVKMLYWAENGFCIWMKRLEKETFRWPESENDVSRSGGISRQTPKSFRDF
ncbi:MAG: hypothetical protein COA36_13280 [Desulfotalea sp.]|nr:MAG: hypothetical protein COA36_13280 [Desulfotalea sp.]